MPKDYGTSIHYRALYTYTPWYVLTVPASILDNNSRYIFQGWVFTYWSRKNLVVCSSQIAFIVRKQFNNAQNHRSRVSGYVSVRVRIRVFDRVFVRIGGWVQSTPVLYFHYRE